jgi:Adenylate and Guanylate cyclase catalytic domain
VLLNITPVTLSQSFSLVLIFDHLSFNQTRDIVGFTAWCSVREPSQIFTLLETLYHAFDEIATRRRVFKVETVGDCYVAVCGLVRYYYCMIQLFACIAFLVVWF